MVQTFMRDLKKVSALWSVLFRVSALERFCYKGFLWNSSGTKFFVCLREVSALEDVHFREVPLYLEIPFDLKTSIYKPFNNNSLHINASSHHPPSVLKQIPRSVSKKIIANSYNEDVFRKSARFYNSILQDCEFNENIKYCPEESTSSRRVRNRSRNIIWYNPPFSKKAETNAGKHFFQITKETPQKKP